MLAAAGVVRTPGILSKNWGLKGDSRDGLGAGLMGLLRVSCRTTTTTPLPPVLDKTPGLLPPGSEAGCAYACMSQQRVQPGSGWSRLQLRVFGGSWPVTDTGEAPLILCRSRCL